jgi:DeoR/GlpR family transcriptional regulator of sugar metabolism
LRVIVRDVLAQQRYDRILAELRTERVLGVHALAEALGVSEATVRRDLQRLSEDGMVERVRGGARCVITAEPAYHQVAARPHADRDLVAEAAASLVTDGDVLLLDIGTTVHALAARLHGLRVTVITSNLAVYEELAGDTAVELILLGGAVRRNYRSLVGFLTEQALANVRADRLFLGTAGIRPDGTVLDTTTVEVPVKQAMLRAADQVILLATPDKFPGSGMAKVCGPEAIDVLVCRSGTDPTTLAPFTEADCSIMET